MSSRAGALLGALRRAADALAARAPRPVPSLRSWSTPPLAIGTRTLHASAPAPMAKKPALSGWATWVRARKRRSVKARFPGTLTKQAAKVRNHLVGTWKIYRGDRVMVNAGKDRGQVGTVTKVFRKENRLLVEGVNLVKKHVKRTEQNQTQGVITMESPIHYSNVNLVDPVTGSPTRIAMRYLEDGSKVRVTRGRLASGSVVPKPDVATQRRRPKDLRVGRSDTTWQDALKNTYAPSPANEGTAGGGFFN